MYQTVKQDVEREGAASQAAQCRRCGEPLPSKSFIVDLKNTLRNLNQDYDLGPEQGSLQDYCPTCKRILRGRAYFATMGKRFL